MATRHQPPSARVAGDDPPAAAGRDDSTAQALARSREIREQGRLLIEQARDRVAAARRRSDPGAVPGPAARDSAAGFIGAGEQVERSQQSRARLAELAGELVRTEETVAHIHDEMAARDSGRAAQYRRAAEDARQAACRAREIQRNAGSDPR